MLKKKRGIHRPVISLPISTLPDSSLDNLTVLSPVSVSHQRNNSDYESFNTYPTHMRKLAKSKRTETQVASGILFSPRNERTVRPISVAKSPKAVHSPMYKQQMSKHRLAVDYNTGVRLRITHKNTRLRSLLYNSGYSSPKPSG